MVLMKREIELEKDQRFTQALVQTYGIALRESNMVFVGEIRGKKMQKASSISSIDFQPLSKYPTFSRLLSIFYDK